MNARGFTLIELMIVLAIVAIITAIAVPSLLRSRMAANEISAIGTCKAFGSAQEIYRRTDWDGDGFLEYAKNIGPNGGLGNGESLYFCVARSETIALVDKSFADAEGDPLAAGVNAKGGYCFKVQTSATYPTNRTFLDVQSNLMSGWGLSAVPLQYNVTGVNKFQFSSDGVIYQADKGDNAHLLIYNTDPANGWVATE